MQSNVRPTWGFIIGVSDASTTPASSAWQSAGASSRFSTHEHGPVVNIDSTASSPPG